jgi:hypothetical protein
MVIEIAEGEIFSKIVEFLSNQIYQQVRAAKVGETDLSLVHEKKHSESEYPSQVFFIFRIRFNLPQTDLVNVQWMKKWLFSSVLCLQR